MKKKLTVGVAVVLSCAALGAAVEDGQVTKDSLKETLLKLENQSWEAWKNHDGKFYQNFLSGDHVEVGFSGPADKSAVVNFVNGATCEGKSYSVNHFNLTMLDARTALLTYHAAQDTACGGKAVPSPAWVSSLYIKRDGRWLNALYQQTAESK